MASPNIFAYFFKRKAQKNLEKRDILRILWYNMKDKYMTIDLTPAPVLQELIDDLETKICKLTTELAMLHSENGPRYLTYGIEKQLDVLEEVLERIEAQQELLDLKQNSISLN